MKIHNNILRGIPSKTYPQYRLHDVSSYLFFYLEKNMSGWPSGLRRQTQEDLLFPVMEYSGPLMWAGVRIPLLTIFFILLIRSILSPNWTAEFACNP